ncbi:RHS repeat-associated core domain-containing protein [Streptomyces sp. AM 3-1-1]|uniref:RHS repeat domain-containing protein n=1 Tax=Streptomyces sp. AM 3-1-1 TaxID=3028711 RepID=UPI0023B91A61|nr:RHS repeat-associated core domain-containing protein [Streptomyces sp. AM 3-1-1]WEH30587.1 RHS repeat-associated core domain-containing protein [Streptomyces sp. AM 3-1-1]
MRTGKGFSYLINDHQGTALTAVTAGTLLITRRRQLPFGQSRSEDSETIPGTRGFVGGTDDPTGLVHLGAREYDPTLGRFLSVDPVIDETDPAQMNAYSYAHNNPITQADPDGLRPDGPAGGATYNDDRWAADRGMTAGYTKKNGKWVWNQTPKKDKASQKKYAAYKASPSTYKVFHYDAKKAAAAKAQAKKRAEKRKAEEKRKADVERRKKNGIFGSIMKGNWNDAWENTKNVAPHLAVNVGVGFLATTGTAVCIASVVCGGGLFVVGASALLVGGVAAHMAVGTPEENRDPTHYFASTAKAEAKGMFFGATFGRGQMGAMLRGVNASRMTSAITGRAGSQPLFAGLEKNDLGGMTSRLTGYVKGLW